VLSLRLDIWEVGPMKRSIIGVATAVALLLALAPAAALASDDDPGDDDELQGEIESLPGTPDFVGDWRVGGTTVHVSASTEIDQEHGAVVVGATVEVKGTSQPDGSITADEIEVKDDDEGDDGDEEDEFGEIEFEGFVQALPATAGFLGDWTVSGLTVHVSADTQLELDGGTVAVGDAVKVEGTLAQDGSVTAREIQSEDAQDVDEDSTSLTGIATAVPSGDHVGRWRVSTHAVRVTGATRIVHEGRLDKGSTVRVVGAFRTNGSMRASKIVVKS
jgi:hypothetical protein